MFCHCPTHPIVPYFVFILLELPHYSGQDAGKQAMEKIKSFLLLSRCLCYPYWTGDDCSECGVKGVGKACLPCPPCEHGTCVSDGGMCYNLGIANFY